MASDASRPSRLRRRLGRTARRLGLIGPELGSAPVILLYHRIARPPVDPWGLAVSEDRFREQMEWLKSARTMMAMDDLAAALDVRAVPPRATAVTFDDGYADNALAAGPILERLRVPATIFVTTGETGSPHPFWWDELVAVLFGAEGAGVVEIPTCEGSVEVAWGEDRADAETLRRWRAGRPEPESRCRAYVEAWRVLRRLDPSVRTRAMASLRQQLAPSPGIDAGLPMDAAAIGRLSSRLLTLGAHARTHGSLTSLAADRLQEEISGGRDDLTTMSGGKPPTGFAYPHGDWDEASRAAVAAAGFKWAVAVRGGCVNTRDFDPYTLPRMPVEDWTARQLKRVIVNADR